MRLMLAIALLLAAATSARADDRAARAAYDAKDYIRCAEIYLAEAARLSGDAQGDSLYGAACCQALAGRRDDAFATLDKAVAAGWRTVKHTEEDGDLASLHDDKRWPALLASVRERMAAWEKSLGDPALRRELLALREEDQAARKVLIASNFKDQAAMARVKEIDRKTSARMKEILAAKGWPGEKLVGKDGANAAWLLVQHADHDRPFQKLCLAKMEEAVKRGDARASDWAYLVDRVAVGEGRKQTYGTQFNDKREPQPIEDEAHVDERRKTVGLPTMAEYRQMMIKTYGPPPPPAK